MNMLSLSGDLVRVEDNKLIKICKTNQTRFLNNIEKQKKFNNQYIKSIPIIKQGIINKEYYIEMKLLKCDNSIEWLSRSNAKDIQKLIYILEQYFISLIKNSQVKDFDYRLWDDKIKELLFKISDYEIKTVLIQLQKSKFKNQLYIGDNHGDFALSNLFITKSDDVINVDAFDFLENFINTPINDLVKIRQDTRHHFILHLLNKNSNPLDITKVAMVLNYMDRRIASLIEQDVVLSEFYTPFQILNLIRVLPYTKNQEMFSYLKKEIMELLCQLS